MGALVSFCYYWKKGVLGRGGAVLFITKHCCFGCRRALVSTSWVVRAVFPHMRILIMLEYFTCSRFIYRSSVLDSPMEEALAMISSSMSIPVPSTHKPRDTFICAALTALTP